ncbi:MAG: hypothetical protein WBJ37_09865 [Bacteroidales bacterium]
MSLKNLYIFDTTILYATIRMMNYFLTFSRKLAYCYPMIFLEYASVIRYRYKKPSSQVLYLLLDWDTCAASETNSSLQPETCACKPVNLLDEENLKKHPCQSAAAEELSLLSFIIFNIFLPPILFYVSRIFFTTVRIKSSFNLSL